jgi:hypothetical protein
MKRTVLLLLIVLVSLPLQAAGLRFKPGLWEITASTAGPPPHAQTTRRCYTPDEVKVANGSAAEVATATRANAATQKLESKGCKLQEIQLVGAQITEVIVCPTYSLEDVTTYHQGDTFESDTTMAPKQGPARKVHRVARRVGDCPK